MFFVRIIFFDYYNGTAHKKAANNCQNKTYNRPNTARFYLSGFWTTFAVEVFKLRQNADELINKKT